MIADDKQQCCAYCKLLAQRHPVNAKGASLVKIVLFQVEVILAPPGADAMAHYQEQNRLTANPPLIPGTFHTDAKRASTQVRGDLYEFDPVTGKGCLLESDPL